MSVMHDIQMARGDFLNELSNAERSRADLKLYLAPRTADEFRNELVASHPRSEILPLRQARVFGMAIGVCPRLAPCGMKIERTDQ